MNFSFDTNIILGIINTKDRLHEKSKALIDNKRNEQLYLCHSAIKESHNVLRNKINEVMVDIIRFLPDIYQSSSISTLDSQAFLIEQFKNLKAAKPGLSNFLNLVYHEISIFLKDNEIDDLPDFLSELSLNLSNSIILKIEETHPDFEILFLNHDGLNIVKRSLADIHFKDTNDGRIFQELMTNLEDIKPIEFFLDDRDFAKKCNVGFTNIANDMEFNESDFSCNQV